MPKLKTCRKCGFILNISQEECPTCKIELTDSDIKIKEIIRCPDCNSTILHFKCRNCGRTFEDIEFLGETTMP